MIKITNIISGALKTNCYLVYDDVTLDTIVIDPGEDGYQVINIIDKNIFNVIMLINTHSHLDHSQSNNILRKQFNIPLAIHKYEVDFLCSNLNPEILLHDQQIMNLSNNSFMIMHTPGHTKGSICLLFENFLFTGDTLFAGTIGRTDLPTGNDNDMLNSLAKIKRLKQSLIIYPGHGKSTMLKYEVLHNPYLIDN